MPGFSIASQRCMSGKTHIGKLRVCLKTQREGALAMTDNSQWLNEMIAATGRMLPVAIEDLHLILQSNRGRRRLLNW
jgi:hypothetical protein